MGAWSALGLVALRLHAPPAGRTVTTVLAASAGNDVLQTAFTLLCARANAAQAIADEAARSGVQARRASRLSAAATVGASVEHVRACASARAAARPPAATPASIEPAAGRAHRGVRAQQLAQRGRVDERDVGHVEHDRRARRRPRPPRAARARPAPRRGRSRRSSTSTTTPPGGARASIAYASGGRMPCASTRRSLAVASSMFRVRDCTTRRGRPATVGARDDRLVSARQIALAGALAAPHARVQHQAAMTRATATQPRRAAPRLGHPSDPARAPGERRGRAARARRARRGARPAARA